MRMFTNLNRHISPSSSYPPIAKPADTCEFASVDGLERDQPKILHRSALDPRIPSVLESWKICAQLRSGSGFSDNETPELGLQAWRRIPAAVVEFWAPSSRLIDPATQRCRDLAILPLLLLPPLSFTRTLKRPSPCYIGF